MVKYSPEGRPLVQRPHLWCVADHQVSGLNESTRSEINRLRPSRRSHKPEQDVIAIYIWHISGRARLLLVPFRMPVRVRDVHAEVKLGDGIFVPSSEVLQLRISIEEESASFPTAVSLSYHPTLPLSCHHSIYYHLSLSSLFLTLITSYPHGIQP